MMLASGYISVGILKRQQKEWGSRTKAGLIKKDSRFCAPRQKLQKWAIRDQIKITFDFGCIINDWINQGTRFYSGQDGEEQFIISCHGHGGLFKSKLTRNISWSYNRYPSEVDALCTGWEFNSESRHQLF